jgi:hypothetical protein
MSDEHRIITKLNELMAEVQTIKRGVYGDKNNGVNGLIHHQRDHLQRIIDLEDSKKKAVWFGAGAIAILQVLWHLVIDWFKTHK